MKLSTDLAVDALFAGGVVAYPTEGVYGLGCLPDDMGALLTLMRIKGRALEKGLILLAAEKADLEGWITDDDLDRLPAPESSAPVTWIAKRGPLANPFITGANPGVAVRLTTNKVAARLCEALEGPITSTSANRSGRPVAANRYVLRRTFAHLVDFIVPGDCGPATGPSEIRVLETGQVIRPGK